MISGSVWKYLRAFEIDPTKLLRLNSIDYSSSSHGMFELVE